MPDKPYLHGRDHRPGGADPIPDFNVETSSVMGSLTRSGAAGNMSILSGALNATTTLVQHDVISVDSGVECDIVSTPSRIIIETAGMYIVKSVLIDIDSGSTDYGLAVGHAVNATTAIFTPGMVSRRTLGGHARATSIQILSGFDVGDYITQVVGQDSGSTKTFTYLATLVVALIPEGVLNEGSTAELDGGGA